MRSVRLHLPVEFMEPVRCAVGKRIQVPIRVEGENAGPCELTISCDNPAILRLPDPRQVETPVDGRAEFEFVEELRAQRPTIEPVWVTVSIATATGLSQKATFSVEVQA